MNPVHSAPLTPTRNEYYFEGRLVMMRSLTIHTLSADRRRLSSHPHPQLKHICIDQIYQLLKESLPYQSAVVNLQQ